jgi:chemotaxis protein CheY-P-specific phosphatase CheC
MFMLEYLRNAMNTILEKSTGCVKIIYKKLNKDHMATNDLNTTPDSNIDSSESTDQSKWIVHNMSNNSFTTYSTPMTTTTLSMPNMSTANIAWNTTGITGAGGVGGFGGGGGTTYTFTNPLTYTNGLSGGLNLDKDADIKIGDRSLKEFMDTVSDRLAILQPDPAKLEQFAALKAAYEHYKMLERLIGDAEPGNNEQ